MTRLDQLIYNVCNRVGWNFRVRLEVQKFAQKMSYIFQNDDEELMKKAVNAGIIDLEELYYEYLDTLDTEEFLDDESFFVDSYFPELVEKSVGEGAWIRVSTDIGFNVYYAKASPRKIDYNRKMKSIQMRMKSMNSETSMKDLKKTEEMLREGRLLATQQEIGIDPYYVSYRKTKSTKEYLLPHEYELIKDIEFYMDVTSDRIKLKLYSQNDIEDKVFYMQSRGISRKKAMSMCAAGQGYFVVDLKGMVNDERVANGLQITN